VLKDAGVGFLCVATEHGLLRAEEYEGQFHNIALERDGARIRLRRSSAKPAIAALQFQAWSGLFAPSPLTPTFGSVLIAGADVDSPSLEGKAGWPAHDHALVLWTSLPRRSEPHAIFGWAESAPLRDPAEITHAAAALLLDHSPPMGETCSNQLSKEA
jgi:hypothetical protein